MSKYFSHFPKTVYLNTPVTDITRRARFNQGLTGQPYLFLPYTVSLGDRPEDVAYLYYGSVDYTWLVLYANDIYDPLTQWPKDASAFQQHLIAKYKQQANTEGFAVIAWTQSEVKHYENVDDSGTLISPDTYNYEPSIVAEQWSAVSIYDWEDQQNSDARQIRLVNRAYADSVVRQFRESISR